MREVACTASMGVLPALEALREGCRYPLHKCRAADKKLNLFAHGL